MSNWIKVRQAISGLLDAGETPTSIVRTLCCSRTLVYKVKKLKEKKDSDLGRLATLRSKRVMTPRVRKAIEKKIRANPNKSLTAMGDEVGVNRKNVSRLVKEIGGKSLRRIKVPLISAEGRERRASRALGLLNDMKSARPRRIVFFSDEKNFVVDPVFNPQNDRYVRLVDPNGGMGDAGRYMPRSKHLSLIHI